MKIKIFWAGNPNIEFQGANLLHNILDYFEDNEDIIFIIGGYSEIDKLYKNCIILPQINNNIINSFIIDSDILLALYGDYQWSPIGFYNSSLKFFDYMASGKAVIAPNYGQIAEIGVHKENLILYNSIDDLIYGIKYLIADHNIRNKIGHAGRRLVISKYTWHHSVDNIVKYLKAN